MSTPYHRPGSQDGDSDDEHDPFTGGYDANASTDRIPLTQAIPDQRVAPPYSASPPAPYGERPTSRYTLSETYAPSSGPVQRPPSGAFPATDFPTQRVRFPDIPGQRPVSVMSNMTDDWIARQQPLEASQADLRRYQTRRVKLTRGSIFSADYPYADILLYMSDHCAVFPVPSRTLSKRSGETLNLAVWNFPICDVRFPFVDIADVSRHGCHL